MVRWIYNVRPEDRIFVEKLRNTLHIDMTKERLQNSTWLEIHRIDSLVQQNSKAGG